MKKQKTSTSNLLFAALCTVIVAIFAQFSFSIGPIPFSMGIFGVMLISVLLSPSLTLLSLATYLLLGAFGVPVFSNMGAGVAALFGPTGGFLIGYLPLGWVMSATARRSKNFGTLLAGSLVGLSLCYLCGTLYYTILTGTPFLRSLSLCVTPFILPDIIKLGAALALGQTLSNRLRQSLHLSM